MNPQELQSFELHSPDLHSPEHTHREQPGDTAQEAMEEPESVCVDELYLDYQKIDQDTPQLAATNQLNKLARKYGQAYVAEKIAIVRSIEARQPLAALKAACKENWQPERTGSQSKQERQTLQASADERYAAFGAQYGVKMAE